MWIWKFFFFLNQWTNELYNMLCSVYTKLKKKERKIKSDQINWWMEMRKQMFVCFVCFFKFIHSSDEKKIGQNYHGFWQTKQKKWKWKSHCHHHYDRYTWHFMHINQSINQFNIIIIMAENWSKNKLFLHTHRHTQKMTYIDRHINRLLWMDQ